MNVLQGTRCWGLLVFDNCERLVGGLRAKVLPNFVWLAYWQRIETNVKTKLAVAGHHSWTWVLCGPSSVLPPLFEEQRLCSATWSLFASSSLMIGLNDLKGSPLTKMILWCCSVILSMIAGTEVLRQMSHTTSPSIPIIFLTDFLVFLQWKELFHMVNIQIA